MQRALLLVLCTAGGIVIGFCLAVILYRPGVTPPSPYPTTTTTTTTTTPVHAPAASAAVTPLRVDDNGTHWPKSGFVEMTPPTHLPSDQWESDHIVVWLRIPDGKTIAVRMEGERPVLQFPVGTTADRVESYFTDAGFSVADVRGTTLTDGGERWHVLVPADDKPLGALVGWEWSRSDEGAHDAATEALLDHLATTRTLHDQRTSKDRLLESYRKNNACGRCHYAGKPENLVDPTAIHRPTDDSGWYVPSSVLQDALPLETHRPRDMNAGDPFIALECPSGAAPLLNERDDSGRRHYRCADGKVPVGTLDVKQGIVKKDPHVLAVCASRKYLAEHMEPAARKIFAAVLAECGL